MFKIGEFSKICRVPVSALRYYADIGLLPPSHVDSSTGYRYYSADQLPRLNRILALRDLGLSLDQIKQALDDHLTLDEMRGMLRMRQAEIARQVEDDQARLNRVAARLIQIEQEGKLMPEQEVILKSIEPQTVLAIREVIAQPEYVGTLLGESYAALGAHGITPAGPPLTIYHDQEFKPNDMDIEVVLPVGSQVTDAVSLDGGRQLTAYTLAGINTAACILHKGDYDRLEVSYNAIARWIERSGYRVAGPPREIYLTAPGDPAGILTEIQYPVIKG
ncbi:MAG: MerR family transcriptional regulator [Anaerolineae bacterium]|nr:MerR family transcriptional regulator [Anaerolineae bacterium]